MAKLFIVGFPKDMEEIELVEMFTIHGIVNTVTIITDKDTGASKGYGFITMADDAGAQRAIAAFDGATIDDRTISVRIADDKTPEKAPPPPQKTFQKPYQKKPDFRPNPGQRPAEFGKKKRPRRPQ